MHNNAGEQDFNRLNTDRTAFEKFSESQKAVDQIRTDMPPIACGRGIVPETYSEEIASLVEEASKVKLREFPGTSGQQGRRPPIVRIGRSVRYRASDIYKWIDAQIEGGAHEA